MIVKCIVLERFFVMGPQGIRSIKDPKKKGEKQILNGHTIYVKPKPNLAALMKGKIPDTPATDAQAQMRA